MCCRLVVMALTAALGIVLLFLGCALHFPDPSGPGALGVSWWGLFVLPFYLLSPIPLAIARKCLSEDYLSPESSNLLHEVCYFLSACIVVSGFGLPVVLARQHIIQLGSAGLIAGANLFVFATVYSYFVFFGREDEWDWTTF